MFSEEQVNQACLKYFNGDKLAASSAVNKYLLRNKEGEWMERDPDDMHDRLARELFRIESNYPNPVPWATIRRLLDRFKYIVPQGSPMAEIGNTYTLGMTSNCTVIRSPEDSIVGIMEAAKEMALLYKSRAGVGLDISSLRPAGTPVNNAAKTSTGAASFANLFSVVTETIGQAGRRGANMQSLSVVHPDAEAFASLKADKRVGTASNLSLRLTDEFMKAVVADTEFTQQWPVDVPVEQAQMTRRIRARDLWNVIIHNAWATGDPGLLFWDRHIDYNPSSSYEKLKPVSTNPCITGDTQVFVADGRGAVPIRELAEAEIDVPVFCYDNEKKLTVRLMRHPRLTGTNTQIFKITLDNGHEIRATGNHKFLTKDGEYKRVDKLQPGESLQKINKHLASIKESFGWSHKRAVKDYWWVQNGNHKLGEHRYIAEYAYQQPLPIACGLVVHHKDFDTQNNAPSNLIILSKEHHDAIHKEHMMGDNNPMRRARKEWTAEQWAEYHEKMSAAVAADKNGRAKPVSNEVIRAHAKQLVAELGYRPSEKEWRRYCRQHMLPVPPYKGWRQLGCGTTSELLLWAAEESHITNAELDPRIVRTFQKACKQGYDACIVNGQVFVKKICEHCGNSFDAIYGRREVAFCSISCVMSKTQNDPLVRKRVHETRAITDRSKAEKTKEQQARIYSELLFQARNNDEQLYKAKWEEACAAQGVPQTIGRSRFGYQSWEELVEAGENYNHKVVSVEPCGFEDVYNGTVDEFHNFFISAGQRVDERGRPIFDYINNLNCGEQALASANSCRLFSINLSSYIVDEKAEFTRDAQVDYDLLAKHVEIAIRLIDDMVDIELEKLQQLMNKAVAEHDQDSYRLWEAFREIGQLGRSCGLAIHGLADLLIKCGVTYGSPDALVMMDKIFTVIRDSAYRSSIELAKERGAFPLYDETAERDNEYIQSLPEDIRLKMKQFGRRNVALLTCAPTGTVSLLSRTSSGIEPVYDMVLTRRKKLSTEEAKTAEKVVYDEAGRAFSETLVIHPLAEHYYQKTGATELPDFFVSAPEIAPLNRILMQAHIQKYVDSSISSCVPGDTYISTTGGFRRIRDLVPNDQGRGFVPLKESVEVYTREGRAKKVKEGFYNGLAATKKVVFGKHDYFIGTPNHKLSVLNESYEQEWKRLDELKPGDWVVSTIGQKMFHVSEGTKIDIQKCLGPFQSRAREGYNSKEVTIPKYLTTDLGRFLGYMTSDGSINNNGFSLSQTKNSVIDDFKQLSKKLFDIECSVQLDTRTDNLYSVVGNSRVIRDFLEYLGITRDCGTKVVPKIIMEYAGANTIAQYLKGLTLDGFISQNKIGIMTTISYTLAKQVVLLLGQLGVLSNITESPECDRTFPSGKTYHCQKSYVVYVSELHAPQAMRLLGGYAEERKNSEHRKFMSRHSHQTSRPVLPGLVPDYELRRKIRREILPTVRSNKIYDYIHSICSLSAGRKALDRETILTISDCGQSAGVIPEIILDRSLLFKEVKEVIDDEVVETFDLHVEDDHSYLANNLISHNTVNLPKETTEETISDIYTLAWQHGLKGVTVFRDGCRMGLLTSSATSETGFAQHEGPRRPERLDCDIHHTEVKGEKWVVLVGKWDGKPYEVFAGLERLLPIPRNITQGHIVKRRYKTKNSEYDLYWPNCAAPIENLIEVFENKTHSVLGRLISLALRHGCKPTYIAEQLFKDPEFDFFTYNKVIARIIKKYIEDGAVSGDKCPECGEQMIYENGCAMCKHCGYGKCG